MTEVERQVAEILEEGRKKMNKFKQELEEIAILAKMLKKRETEIQAHIVFESILLRDTEQFLRFVKEEGLPLSSTNIQSGYIASANLNGQSFHVMFSNHERNYLLKEGLL